VSRVVLVFFLLLGEDGGCMLDVPSWIRIVLFKMMPVPRAKSDVVCTPYGMNN
jgi:hypothetical protein